MGKAGILRWKSTPKLINTIHERKKLLASHTHISTSNRTITIDFIEFLGRLQPWWPDISNCHSILFLFSCKDIKSDYFWDKQPKICLSALHCFDRNEEIDDRNDLMFRNKHHRLHLSHTSANKFNATTNKCLFGK